MLKNKIKYKINLINKKIVLLKKIKQKSIKDIFSKINFNSGKRIRGLLLLSVASVYGKEIDSALTTYAAAIELLHLASLIHDDVIDNAEKRRGVLTLHRTFGKELSILAGDYLFSFVSKIIFKEKKLEIFNIFIKTVNDICTGAIDEQYNKGNVYLSEKKYIDIIKKKTGSLIQASVEIGALLAGVNNNDYKNLKKFGINCGIAFQITDDILDITGNEKELGKPAGSDICEERITLPLLKAFQNSSSIEKKEIIKIYKGKKTKENLNKIINFIKANNGIKDSRKEAESYINNAKKYLSFTKLNGNKEELFFLTDYILNRTF